MQRVMVQNQATPTMESHGSDKDFGRHSLRRGPAGDRESVTLVPRSRDTDPSRRAIAPGSRGSAPTNPHDARGAATSASIGCAIAWQRTLDRPGRQTGPFFGHDPAGGALHERAASASEQLKAVGVGSTSDGLLWGPSCNAAEGTTTGLPRIRCSANDPALNPI